MTPTVCDHGCLAQCTVCERDREIAALITERDEARALWVCIQTFVSHERALRDSLGKGGQSCGNSPSMTVSTLRTLERFIRDAPEVSQRYCDEIARLTSELAHVARSLAWQQDERRKAEAERDEARAELAAISTAAGAYPDSDIPSLVATLNRAATAYDDQHDMARLTADRDKARVARDPS